MSQKLAVALAMGLAIGFMAYYGLTSDWSPDQRASLVFLDDPNIVLDETQSPTLRPTTMAPSTLAPTMTPTLTPTMTPTSTPTTSTPTTSTPTTSTPTAPPVNYTAACLKLPKPVLLRELLNLTACQTTIPRELLEDPTVYANPPADLESKPVVFLEGGDWGQLCNKIGILAGAFRDMANLTSDMGNTILALSPPYSKTAWAFDPEMFSSRVFGVLMDCVECRRDLPKVMRCSSIIIKGKVYDVSDQVFTAAQQVVVVVLYYHSRPKQLGYMEEMNHVIQPQKAVKYLVNQTLVARFLPVAEGEWSVGLHQRYMDSMGFRWLLDRIQYNCHPRADFGKEIAALSKVMNGERKEYFWNATSPENGFYLRKITAQARQEFELAHHLLITSNYSLSPTQVGILKQEWPLLFSKPRIKILLATDNQTPASESEMRQIDFGTIHKLEEYDSCVAKIRHHNMLADMWAMSLLDLHMANPLSSCDDVVVQWRRKGGKPAGSSYPPKCYDGYYS